MWLNKFSKLTKSWKTISVIATLSQLIACWSDGNSTPDVVEPINNAPVANDDSATTSYNTSIYVDVLVNDTDADNDVISLTGVFTNQEWWAFTVDNNQVLFTPEQWFYGVASATYENTDGELTSTGQLVITVEEPEKALINFQLGWAITGSYVAIQTQDGDEIVSGTTDESGLLTIIVPDVESKLAEFGYTINDSVLITATGWVDIDPDGDGLLDNDTDRSIEGSLTAFASFDNITAGYVTSISTIIDGVTLSHLISSTANFDFNLYDKTVSTFLEQKGFVDINDDGAMNYIDVISYNVVNQDSPLETETKANLNEAIYSGDGINEAIIEYQTSTNLISEEVTETDTEIEEIQLSKLNPNSYIEYYIVRGTQARQQKWATQKVFTTNNDDYSWIPYVEWDTIDLNAGETLGYRENFSGFEWAVIEYTNSNNSPLNLSEIDCDNWIEIFEWESQTCFMTASDADGILTYTATLNWNEIQVTSDEDNFSISLESMELWTYELVMSYTSNTYDWEPESGEESLTISVVEDIESNAQQAKEAALAMEMTELLEWATEVEQSLIDTYDEARAALIAATTAAEITPLLETFNTAFDTLNAARITANEEYLDSLQVAPLMWNVPNTTIANGWSYTEDVSAYVTLTNWDPITWYTLTWDALPIGISFNSTTWVFSWTTTATGTYNFTVTASDNDGASDSDAFSLTVDPVPNTAPTASSFSVDAWFWETVIYNLSPNIDDAETSDSLLTIVDIVWPSHGSLTWNGNEFTYTVTDGTGYIWNDSFSFKVQDPQWLKSNRKTVTITNIWDT